MRKCLVFTLLLNFSAFTSSYGLAGGSGFQYEELIPKDEFNPANLGVVKGKVHEVLHIPKTNGIGNNVVAIFLTNDGKDKVYAVLAPDWYLKNLNLEITKGMNLVVKGSKIEVPEHFVVIVTEIDYNNKTIQLRDKKTGTPEWKEWRSGEELFYKNYKW